MTSECFYNKCFYHETHDLTEDDGPFCHEPKCRATPHELNKWENERKQFLAERNWVDIPNQK